jgi:hypothetical protein
MVTWVILSGWVGSIVDMPDVLTDSTIEAKRVPTIYSYEDIVVDFRFEVLMAVNEKSTVIWVLRLYT